MYYFIAIAVLILILRTFNLVPQLSNKFWRSVDYAIIGAAFLILLTRIPPFVSGVLLTSIAFYAYKKGFFNKFN
jgi:multisubunit Na+/H+ antiporter MnhB subunit